jgi:tyramine---L-glutamate ligase
VVLRFDDFGARMLVFVSEYVCGGAWPDEALDNSLVAEGRAMLVSLVEDLLHIPSVEVVTTWDHRLRSFPLAASSKCEVVNASSPAEEQRLFERLCEESAAAFVIAPEFHGILAARVEIASSRTKLVGCDVAATALCSDKLKLAEFLNTQAISTVPTESFEPACIENLAAEGESNFPCVIKPQDGAGSLLTFKVANADELAQVADQLLSDDVGFSFVRQPFLEGTVVSCAAIVTAGQGKEPEDRHIDVLPPCEQVLSADGRFGYEGADFPIRSASLSREPVTSDFAAATPLLFPPGSPSFPLRRDTSRQHTGLGSRPRVREPRSLRGIDSVRAEQIERLVRRCCSVIPGLSGYVGFDLLILHEENAEPVVVEINPRLTTGFLLWQKMCNDNLATRMLSAVGGMGVTDRPPLSWKTGSHSIRISSLSE